MKAATTFMNALKNILKQKSGEIMNFITLLLSLVLLVGEIMI